MTRRTASRLSLFSTWLVLAATPACSEDDDGNGGASESGGTSSISGGSGGTSARGGSGGMAGDSGDLDLAVCDPSAGPFATTGDNPFFPLTIGRVLTYQGMEDGAVLDLRITTLDETEEVAGVGTRVVEEYEEEDGELVEISRNYFAEAPDGTVCYFGEDVDIYEGGQVVSHEGAWRAGGNSRAGIIMPADPMVGQTYQQEVAPEVALDRAEHVAMGDEISVPAGTFSDTLWVVETSPLDSGAQSEKTYARGVGLVFDDGLELVEISEP